jgi:hypothetical protein
MPAASSSLIDPAVGQLVPAAQSPGQEPAWLPDARRHRHHHAGRRDRGQLQHDEVLHHRGPIPGGPEPAGGGGDGRRQPGRSERLEADAHTVTVAAAARRAGSASPAAGPGWWPGRPDAGSPTAPGSRPATWRGRPGGWATYEPSPSLRHHGRSSHLRRVGLSAWVGGIPGAASATGQT